MDDKTKRRQSIYETVEKIGGKSRRRSLFEDSAQSINEKRNTDSHIKEWDQRWGRHNIDIDSLNVIEFPEEFVKKVKGEINLWIMGLKEMMERAEEFASEIEYNIILEQCELSPDQKASLQDIDTEINKVIQNSNAYLKSIEVCKHLKELEVKKINRDIKFVEKLVGFGNNIFVK